MKIAVVHNRYAADSGEETVVENLLALLEAQGHVVALFTRSSSEINRMFLGRARAFLSGIFSIEAKSAFSTFLRKTHPEVVHVHNVFPLISPSILIACRKMGVPVVMSVHNYRLLCPTGLLMPKKEPRICERCCGGHEYWCVLKNCEGSIPKSLGYALRNYIARKARLYRANVSLYACLTDFQRRRLISEGYPEDRMAVVPNMVPTRVRSGEGSPGDYVGFAGRVSPEKGISVLISAARKCPDIRFLVAGSYDRMPDVLKTAPDNCLFVGHLCFADLMRFYASSRMVVVPSLWYEAFGLCAAEAQAHGKAVICSRIGALPEIVDCGVTGLLFKAGDADDLAERIRYLWDRPELCRQMGEAGRARVLSNYSPEKYYERIMDVYRRAIELGPPEDRG